MAGSWALKERLKLPGQTRKQQTQEHHRSIVMRSVAAVAIHRHLDQDEAQISIRESDALTGMQEITQSSHKTGPTLILAAWYVCSVQIRWELFDYPYGSYMSDGGMLQNTPCGDSWTELEYHKRR